MKTRSSILTMAIAVMAVAVAVPVPDANAGPPNHRLGTNRNHVSENQGDRITLMDFIARRLARAKDCCAKSPCASQPAAEPASRSTAKEKNARPRNIRPYWKRKHG